MSPPERDICALTDEPCASETSVCVVNLYHRGEQHTSDSVFRFAASKPDTIVHLLLGAIAVRIGGQLKRVVVGYRQSSGS